MHPLPTHFDDATFHYTQIVRQGAYAIYAQRHKAGQAIRYEVVRIRERPAHTWPNGDTTPAHEAYPGATAWGREGFTAFTLAAAQRLFTTLQRKGETVHADAD